jgi:hypothetical protein
MPTQEQYEQSEYGKEETKRIGEHFSEFFKNIPVYNPIGKWGGLSPTKTDEQKEGGSHEPT